MQIPILPASVKTLYVLRRPERALYGSAESIALVLLGVTFRHEVARELLADTIREVEYHGTALADDTLIVSTWVPVKRGRGIAHNRCYYMAQVLGEPCGHHHTWRKAVECLAGKLEA